MTQTSLEAHVTLHKQIIVGGVVDGIREEFSGIFFAKSGW